MNKLTMISQAIYLWIVCCVAAESVYPLNSGLVHTGNENDSTADSSNSSILHLEGDTRITVNATDSTKSATSKNFVSTETIVDNDNFLETVSTFNISPVDRNEIQVSPFPSGGSSTVTVELRPVNGVTNTTSVTNSETLEANKTRADTKPSTAVTSEINKTWTNTALHPVATSESIDTWTDTELATAATSKVAEEPDEWAPDNCTYPGNCVFTKDSGYIRLREDATEQSFFYTISVPGESSLISVEMEPEKGNLIPDSNITFDFEECETTQAKWLIEATKKMEREIYISKGSNLTLHIFTDKSWINVTLRYKKLAFEKKEEKVKDTVDEGVLRPPMLAGIRYKPMTQITYFLTASKSRWNESSVMITVSYVDLDEGDYLLIGAGNSLFAGPEPFYFTGRINKGRNYCIASDDVYVHFVSGASQKIDKKGFHIKWKRSGTAITNPDEDLEEDTIPDYIIQSVGICFFNKSLLAEFNRSEDYEGPVQRFREKLASVANKYAKQNHIALDSLLTASSVEIYRVSSVIEPIEDVMPEGGLYVMVSIVHHFDRKTAVFRRTELEKIVDQLDKENEKSDYSMLGFRAGHCPSVDSNLEWYIAAVLLVTISTITLIIVWICTSVSKWRGFTNSKKSSGQLGNVYCKEPEIPARENDYIRYTPGINKPQMKLTTCDGDTTTLESESPGQSREEQDDGPDRVLFHQDWIMKKRPSSIEVTRRMIATAEIETRKPFLQTFAAPIPSTRKKESDRMWIDIQMDSLLPQESTHPVDHEYDCLIFPVASSSSTTCLVNHEGETKL